MQAFSGDELVFNDTMKDWRTHNGMDLAGAAGRNGAYRRCGGPRL